MYLVADSQNISQLFSAEFHGSHSCDTSECDALHSSLSASLSAGDLDQISVSVECIAVAFSHLKCGKSDGTSLLSDVLISALPAVCTSVASLFIGILRHGYMAEAIRNYILVPIPKGDEDPAKSDNYLPITLAPTLSKHLNGAFLSYTQAYSPLLGSSLALNQRFPLRSVQVLLKM